jgi:seryl-tRNA synthetase
MLDLENAAKVAGARFYYLKSDIALLELSLIRFAIDTLVKKGYTLIAPPLMMKREYYKGVTSLADFEDALYKVGESREAMQNKDIEHIEDELFMISTSEHPIAAMHANHVFSANELPKKYVGWSPCFRREAGAHGKDTKGIFRVHQFYKVEQFIFSRQEDSWKYFEELVSNEEELFKALGIPYRIVSICTGDIGIVAAKKYDLEAYLPVQKRYGEMCSCSNCTDWQSLRLDIKYDEKGERKYVHTLNATAIATERAIVAIIENYTNEDGTITLPDVLVPYMGKRKIG